jgi:hypothetical protein
MHHASANQAVAVCPAPAKAVAISYKNRIASKEMEHMVLVTNNPRVWLIGFLASLVIFAIVFFAVIQPAQNTANQAVKTGLQQSQQAINQAQKQLSNAGAANGVTGKAKQQLNHAAKLTSCIAAAGTDPSKMAACQTQYGG